MSDTGRSRAERMPGRHSATTGHHVARREWPHGVPRIAHGWSELREACRVREYLALTGSLRGVQLTAASTGIGGPGTAVLMEELVKLGAHTFLRVGNSGGLDPSLALGDLVVTTGAVRDDGTTRSYVVPEYPAVADHELVAALLEAGRERGAHMRAGITWSLDAFYVRNALATPDGGMASMSAGSYWTRTHADRIADMRAARVLNCEMEAGTILTLASLFGVRAGAICVVSDRTPWPGPAQIDLDRNMAQCIEIATAAMLRVA
jgi:uridine phosphorylase